MADPTLLSRCWVAGGGTAPGAFDISSPTSERDRERKRVKNRERERDVIRWVFSFTSNQPHATFLFFHLFIFSRFSFSFQPFCCTNLLTPHKVKHINGFTRATLFFPRHTLLGLTERWQFRSFSGCFRDVALTPSPRTHSNSYILSLLSSSLLGSIWRIVSKRTIQERKQLCQQLVCAFVLRPGFDRWRRRRGW